MRTRTLPRRAFLVGAGGATVGLPWLEIMAPSTLGRANAADSSSPCRFVVSMTGTTHMGSTGSPAAGAYTMPGAYEALEPIRDYVSIVSGLTLPQGPPGSIPAGGREVNDGHGSALAPQVTGARVVSGRIGGPSSDTVVADAIGGSTRFPALRYRVQAAAYSGGIGYMSAANDGSPIGPVSSPRLAYDQLFLGFTPPGDTPQPPSDRLLRGASVLDLVLRRSQRLRGVLGSWDRQRLEEHFEQIRALEERVRDIASGNGPTSGGESCAALPDPGADTEPNVATNNTGNPSGWADETTRGTVMADLVHMAFVCDLSRVASLMIGFVSSALSMETIIGSDWDAHSMTHSPFAQSVTNAGELKQRVARWYVDPFARLLTKLHETPEAGGNMLDSTVAVLLWEHGNPGAHNTTDYILPIVGMPGALRHSQWVDGAGRHPAQLLQTAMRAAGVFEDLGEVPGVIDELLE